MSTESEAESAAGKQNGENFNDEMKDYAKSTMNELLGMFGYEEEITREAVEELQIRLLPDEDDEQENKSALVKSTETTETESAEPVAVTLNPNEAPVVVQIPGEENSGNPSVVPLPAMKTEVVPMSEVPQATPELCSLPSGANESAKAGTALSKTTQNKAPTSCDLPRPEVDEGVQVTYTSSPSKKPGQKFGLCKWCKKSNVLQNFTSSDGEKETSCKDLCSALCFEQAVKSIKENQSHINNTQQMSPTIKSVSKKSAPSAPMTRSATRGSVASGKTKTDGSTPKKIPPALGFVLFSWDEYLAKTNSEAAPWGYFRQAQVPPYNGFQCSMKLEVADPRIVDTICVATVVGILGPRIRCRFDGTDSANDVWHLVDSREIHPVGWCEGNGGRLQPPVGFHLDPGKYSTFLAKTLASAELAPVRLFKREPTAPKENMFKVGMKLEALDPKNPLLICVATVADVDGDRIRVDFDGYLGSDYWCRYDSRDLFPVGWCHLSGHPLQPPGKTRKALKVSGKTNAVPEKSVKPEKAAKLDKAAKLEKPVKTARPEKPEKRDKKKIKVTSSVTPATVATSPVPTPVVTTPSSTRSGCDSPSSSGIDPEDGVNHTVQVFINHACEAGPHLSAAKVAGLPTCFRGTVLNVTRDCIQSVVNAAIEPSVVFGFLRSGTGRIKITAKDGKQILSCYLQVIDRVAVFWRVLEKFADNLQCCENLLCGERITGPCPKCGKSVHMIGVGNPQTFRNAVCVFELNTGTPLRRHYDNNFYNGYKFYGGMANQVLVLRTVATVYNYDYVLDFIFYQNGVIEVKMSASGYIFGAFYNSNMDPYAYPLHEDFTSGTHDHLINYKVDLDVGGRGNSYETIEIGIENITERWFPNRRRVQKVLKRDVKKTEMDASYKFDFDHPMYLNFFNEKKKNRMGVKKGYRIQLDNMLKQLYPEDWMITPMLSWSLYQMAITKYKENETQSSSIYNQNSPTDPQVDFRNYLADDDPIMNEDLVAWVTIGATHVPHAEDLPNTATAANSARFFIRPFNYFDEDPSIGSTNAILITPIEPYNFSAQKVERYGTPVGPQCIPKKHTTVFKGTY